MNNVHQSVAALAFAVVGLVGCAHEWNSMSAPHPVTKADLQAVLRDKWSRHLFWIRNVVLDNANSDLRSRDFTEKAVATNARDIARTFIPFYGEAASDRLYAFLTKHYGAVKAYSQAAVAGNKDQQEAAMALFASNTDVIATFFSGINPTSRKTLFEICSPLMWTIMLFKSLNSKQEITPATRKPGRGCNITSTILPMS